MALILRDRLINELLDRMYELKATYDLPDRLLRLLLSAYLSNSISESIFPTELFQRMFNDADKINCISIDVQQFAPNNLIVKTDGVFVIIEGSHDEKEDEHGFIARAFKRRVKLPVEECDVDDVSAELSTDGVLSVFVKKPGSVTSIFQSCTETYL